jgi:putative two-component system response regulator
MRDDMADSMASIIVVDDEPLVRDLLSRWLTDAGYSCRHAGCAEEAWEAIQEGDVDLLTLDVNLPGASGLELLARVKESLPDTEAIMLTGRADVQAAVSALSTGASGYLIKPVSSEELLFQVDRCLERRRLVIENRQYTHHLEDRVQRHTHDIRLAHEETIHRLVAASRYRDEETGAHIRRVGLYSELLAEAIGRPANEVEWMRMAAPMHDVGKIGIPDAILRKPGKLTPAEYDVMKTHTLIGAKILEGSSSPMLQLAHEIALFHHEHWDGQGYPSGAAAEEIPESARIVALVDVYDALTQDRVYRPALGEAEALDVLEQGRGKHFDPFILRVFLSLVPEVRRIAAQNPEESAVSEAPLTESQPVFEFLQTVSI